MRHRVFTVFDQKALAYLPPFCLPERGQATRAFSDMINNPKHAFGLHPEDYVLFEVANFDDLTGLMEPFQGPELVATALSLLLPGNVSPLLGVSDEAT